MRNISINKRKCYYSFPAFYKSKNKEYFKLEREKSSQYLFLVGKKEKTQTFRNRVRNSTEHFKCIEGKTIEMKGLNPFCIKLK